MLRPLGRNLFQHVRKRPQGADERSELKAQAEVTMRAATERSEGAPQTLHLARISWWRSQRQC